MVVSLREELPMMPAPPTGFQHILGEPGLASDGAGRVLSCRMRGRPPAGVVGPRFRASWKDASSFNRLHRPQVERPSCPEGYRLVSGLPGLAVSPTGVVQSCLRRGRRQSSRRGEVAYRPVWRVMAQGVTDDGYRVVHSSTQLVHRLVLLAYVGLPAPGQVTRHLDGNPGNNAISNLAWGTESENAQDRIRHGRHNGLLGKRRVVRLSIEKARAIRAAFAAGASKKRLAREFGVCTRTIQHVVANRLWRETPPA